MGKAPGDLHGRLRQHLPSSPLHPVPCCPSPGKIRFGTHGCLETLTGIEKLQEHNV